jgi:hypothetical protein
MKIIVTTTTLIALLAIGIIGINNNLLGNAFAQEGDSEIPPLVEPDRNISTMAISTTNQSQPMMMNWTGTIDVESTIGEAFKSKVAIDIINAINTAQTNVGANSFVKKAELTQAHGYLVYKMKVVDENMKKYKVIVDPGNGQVLMKKEVTWYDECEKMKFSGHGIPDEKVKYSGEEQYDKYGHDEDDYDKKKIMIIKDNKY